MRQKKAGQLDSVKHGASHGAKIQKEQSLKSVVTQRRREHLRIKLGVMGQRVKEPETTQCRGFNGVQASSSLSASSDTWLGE